MPDWKVVDIGTKKGGALDSFRSHADRYFGSPAVSPESCLGIDRSDAVREAIESKGYSFMVADIQAKDFQFPASEYYTAFHILEHMQNVERSTEILVKMAVAASKGIWLRLPSYETDQTGSGQLSKYNLRFAWSRWKCHRSEYKIDDVVKAILTTGKMHSLRVLPKVVVTSSVNERVVPESAPDDSSYYDPSMGPKQVAAFIPPVIAEWDIVIRFE